MISPTSIEDKWAVWLKMREVKGVGPGRIKNLYEKGGSLYGMLEIISSAHPPQPEWMQDLREELLKFDYKQFYDTIDLTFKCGGKICTLDDPEYPENLKKSSTAPGIIFYKGSLLELSARSLALVGTVEPTDLGIRRARKLAGLCVKNNIQVISGLARGIDTVSHKTALECGGKTYAVIAHGIDHCYPSENKELFEEISKSGAVISQFSTGTKPSRWMFPARNETMCTLSSGTVIIEAHEKCGSLIQAKHSFNHQRRVFILNSNITTDKPWAQQLVNQGAYIVNDFNVVLKEMAEVERDFQPMKQKQQMQINFTEINNSKKAALLDLDGVIWDSFGLMESLYYDIVTSLKGEISEDEKKIIKSKLNNAPPYIFKCLNVDSNKANEMYKKKYVERIKTGVQYFPEIEDVICTLKENGYYIGIVTSQPLSRYKAIISHCSFSNLIDTAVTWNDIPKSQKKPHPAGILKALEYLKVKPQHAFYVGDDPRDVEAARRAGVYSVAALWGTLNREALLEEKPDLCAETPRQILEIRL